ncbi:hypothetical protein HK104_010710 [Borealophlyctis nickersoniae]|nr:hypothetical protein HK104_010710 [Borealophlyctis nickersoniae]
MPLNNVLIIGAGMGGLCLAQRLDRLNIPYTLFERDPSQDHRIQGGPLGVRSGGPAALRAALPDHLHDQLEKLYLRQPLAQSFDIVDGCKGKLLCRFGPDNQGGDMYIVDRPQLRRILSSGIKITYDKKLSGYEILDDGVIAKFSDGTTAKGDILVGADGSHSAVRHHLIPGVEPQSIGIFTIAGTLEMDWTLHDQTWTTTDASPATLANTMQLVGSDGVSYFLSTWNSTDNASIRMDKALVCWGLGYSGSLPVPDPKDRAAMHAFAIARAKEVIHAKYHPIFEMTPVENLWDGRQVKSMPDIEPWETSRVTLLGDAAHLMTSNGGLGANTAFTDAINLATHLHTLHTLPAPPQTKEITTALHAYESEMLKRGFNAVHECLKNTQRIHPGNRFGEKMRNGAFWVMGFFMGR